MFFFPLPFFLNNDDKSASIENEIENENDSSQFNNQAFENINFVFFHAIRYYYSFIKVDFAVLLDYIKTVGWNDAVYLLFLIVLRDPGRYSLKDSVFQMEV